MDKKFEINFVDGNFTNEESFKAWNLSWERQFASHEWCPESHTNDGTGCLKFVHADRTCTASHLSQMITLVKDAKYKISGYIKFDNITSTTANGNGGAYCTLGDAYIGKYTIQDVPFSADWTYFETFYTASYTGEYAFACKIWGAYGTAYFDDLQILLVQEVDPEVLKHWPTKPIEVINDGFSIVAIGDPQIVVSDDIQKKNTKYYNSMVDIVNHRDDWNIQYMVDMGDITDVSDDERQWDYTVKTHDMLTQKDFKYAISLGNHDYDGLVGLKKGVIVERSTNAYLNAFPYDKQEKWLGNVNFGSYDGTMLDTFHKFTYNGEKYIIIATEYAPTRGAFEWAKKICEENKDSHIIFSNHCLLHPRHDLCVHSEQSDHLADAVTAREMWDGLITFYPNVFLALCGHCDCFGIASLHTLGKCGNELTAVVVNPQGTLGGVEMMAALIKINGTHVTPYAYSPSVKNFYAGSNFDITINRSLEKETGKIIINKGFIGKMFSHTIFDGAIDRYVYTSSDEAVISISDDGTVTANETGEAVFTAMIYTGQSEYSKTGPGARIRVEFNVKVV